VTDTADAGTGSGDCTAGSLPPTVFSGNATHPYERLNLSPAP
jgi:hypothetical protein